MEEIRRSVVSVIPLLLRPRATINRSRFSVIAPRRRSQNPLSPLKSAEFRTWKTGIIPTKTGENPRRSRVTLTSCRRRRGIPGDTETRVPFTTSCPTKIRTVECRLCNDRPVGWTVLLIFVFIWGSPLFVPFYRTSSYGSSHVMP